MSSRLRWLDFDIENRPLAYWFDGTSTAEVTAIAAGFIGEAKVHVWLLGPQTLDEMLEGFRKLYDEADGVTGHYIRKHDLPIINGGLVEIGHAPLLPKLTSDTKLDCIKTGALSQSQENLSQMFDIKDTKFHMTNVRWREANRLTKKGVEITKLRVVGDVRQHQALRTEMIKRDLLGPPKVWSPRAK